MSAYLSKYTSTKTYGHERGLSCAFRQWRAASHCNVLHGYALSFKFTFACTHLDEKNWVVDFGDLKSLESWLKIRFDHTTAVAEDDPMYGLFKEMQEAEIINMIVFPGVGCEMFAKLAFDAASEIIKDKYGDRCWVQSVEVQEHGANSAICSGLE